MHKDSQVSDEISIFGFKLLENDFLMKQDFFVNILLGRKSFSQSFSQLIGCLSLSMQLSHYIVAL